MMLLQWKHFDSRTLSSLLAAHQPYPPRAHCMAREGWFSSWESVCNCGKYPFSLPSPFLIFCDDGEKLKGGLFHSNLDISRLLVIILWLPLPLLDMCALHSSKMTLFWLEDTYFLLLISGLALFSEGDSFLFDIFILLSFSSVFMALWAASFCSCKPFSLQQYSLPFFSFPAFVISYRLCSALYPKSFAFCFFFPTFIFQVT